MPHQPENCKARTAEEAARLYQEDVLQEQKLEIDPDHQDVKRQFRDICEVSLLFPLFVGEREQSVAEIPQVVRILSRKLSNHIAWVMNPDDELACHHARDVRMLARALSLGGYLSENYRSLAVEALKNRISQSIDPSSIFMSNIRSRMEAIQRMHVSADVALPIWSSPAQVADKIRSFRKYGLFKDVNDVLDVVHEGRSR